MKRWKIKNKVTGLDFVVADGRAVLGEMQPEWGKLERPELDEQGEPTGNTIPAEFEIVEEDIAAEVQARELRIYAAKAIEFGRSLIAEVHAMNNAKLLSGQTTFDDMVGFVDSPIVARIERFLQNGSIEMARAAIIALPRVYFTESEIQSIVAKVDAFLSANGRI